MSKKYLYYFSEGNDAFGGDKVTMKNILGGKGAGLAEMTAAGMPVPQGFTITTEACTQYYADGRQINDEITADIFEHVKGLEKITGKTFGDNENPLLVSVRSGARQSMPGMMDTILNLGLNDEAVEGLAKKTNNPRFAYDCYRRFLQLIDLDLEQALRDHHDDVGEHLHETAIAVVCKAGVIGLLGQALNSLVVQAQVQDGVHHAGHGLTRAGTDGDQQGVCVIAELLAGDLLQALDVLEDIRSDLIVDLTAVCIILGAGLRGNGEALRHRHTGGSHLCQTGALAAQNVLHGGLVAAEGLVALAEVVQILFAHAFFTSQLVASGATLRRSHRLLCLWSR